MVASILVHVFTFEGIGFEQRDGLCQLLGIPGSDCDSAARLLNHPFGFTTAAYDWPSTCHIFKQLATEQRLSFKVLESMDWKPVSSIGLMAGMQESIMLRSLDSS